MGDGAKCFGVRRWIPMDTTGFAIAIMAAGKGTRLKSKRPKVLHEIGGQALLLHVIAAAKTVVPSERIYCIVGPIMPKGTVMRATSAMTLRPPPACRYLLSPSHIATAIPEIMQSA